MPDLIPSVMFHSCCPEKRDINPPNFKATDKFQTSKYVLSGWTCEGCKTVVYIGFRKEPEACQP
jgi:hypothetical protein